MGILCSCIPAFQRLIRSLIGQDATVVALERQRNYGKTKRYFNIERHQRPRLGRPDSMYIDSELADLERGSRIHSDSPNTRRPAFLPRAFSRNTMPPEPANTGIVMTTEIEVEFEPAASTQRFELGSHSRSNSASREATEARF